MSIAKRIGVKRAYPVAAATSLHVNTIAVLAAGLAIPLAQAAGTELSAGVVTFAVNNPGAAGAVRVEVEAGEHKFTTTDIVAADVGATAYFVDDRTVSKSHDTNSRPIAGKIIQVDDDGVWVELGV
ncbi:hypothetical protein [Alkalimonas mucilaginosa]|uniref:Uncharacterized protein n=1 Tax=Alkalimonas mucilaginosa TaxID=3057676 RepID=A0ABU7JH72_9GAMM|nr:hypothetical protein [Alkalimonas sp. MEB004]MEE2025034.1 hypothetical protein [Alkalimonas sp. MEB004]